MGNQGKCVLNIVHLWENIRNVLSSNYFWYLENLIFFGFSKTVPKRKRVFIHVYVLLNQLQIMGDPIEFTNERIWCKILEKRIYFIVSSEFGYMITTVLPVSRTCFLLFRAFTKHKRARICFNIKRGVDFTHTGKKRSTSRTLK